MRALFIYDLNCGEKPDAVLQTLYALEPIGDFGDMSQADREDYARAVLMERVEGVGDELYNAQIPPRIIL